MVTKPTITRRSEAARKERMRILTTQERRRAGTRAERERKKAEAKRKIKQRELEKLAESIPGRTLTAPAIPSIPGRPDLESAAAKNIRAQLKFELAQAQQQEQIQRFETTFKRELPTQQMAPRGGPGVSKSIQSRQQTWNTIVEKARDQGITKTKDIQLSGFSKKAFEETQKAAATIRKGAPIVQEKVAVVSPTTGKVLRFPIESVTRGIETAGMIPGGIEVLARRPGVAPAALVVGAEEVFRGLPAAAKADPKQFVSDIVTFGIFFKGAGMGIGKLKTKPTTTPKPTIKPVPKPKSVKLKAAELQLSKEIAALKKDLGISKVQKTMGTTKAKATQINKKYTVKINKLESQLNAAKKLPVSKKSMAKIKKIREDLKTVKKQFEKATGIKAAKDIKKKAVTKKAQTTKEISNKLFDLKIKRNIQTRKLTKKLNIKELNAIKKELAAIDKQISILLRNLKSKKARLSQQLKKKLPIAEVRRIKAEIKQINASIKKYTKTKATVAKEKAKIKAIEFILEETAQVGIKKRPRQKVVMKKKPAKKKPTEDDLIAQFEKQEALWAAEERALQSQLAVAELKALKAKQISEWTFTQKQKAVSKQKLLDKRIRILQKASKTKAKQKKVAKLQKKQKNIFTILLLPKYKLEILAQIPKLVSIEEAIQIAQQIPATKTISKTIPKTISKTVQKKKSVVRSRPLPKAKEKMPPRPLPIKPRGKPKKKAIKVTRKTKKEFTRFQIINQIAGLQALFG